MVAAVTTSNSVCCSPHFFKDIRISALALLKMVMHARSGGTLEVMGLLLGKVDANTMMVMDSFALPVEGTETRVNAQAQAYEYMTAYIEAAKQVRSLCLLYVPCSMKHIWWYDVIILFFLGWSTRECHWLVPQPSRIWLLALRH